MWVGRSRRDGPACECDCGVPDAQRQHLRDVPPGEAWPLCVCPYCGPEPTEVGGRRQCTTRVCPVVAFFAPGGLFLCEECRSSCYRRMRETKQLKRRRSGKEDPDHKDAKDQKKEESSHDGDRSRPVPHGGPTEPLGTELTPMGPVSYSQVETFLDPGDRTLEKFEKP